MKEEERRRAREEEGGDAVLNAPSSDTFTSNCFSAMSTAAELSSPASLPINQAVVGCKIPAASEKERTTKQPPNPTPCLRLRWNKEEEESNKGKIAQSGCGVNIYIYIYIYIYIFITSFQLLTLDVSLSPPCSRRPFSVSGSLVLREAVTFN